MKKFLSLILLSAVIIIISPVAILKESITLKESASITQTSTTEPIKNENTLTVFRSIEQETVEIDFFEYVCGSVAAEMPLSYHEEALKAQAIACYTNALRLKSSADTSSTYHISDNSSIHQGYLNEDQRKEKWGEDFEKYENKLRSIVKSVENIAIYYNDEPCVAAFHAICSGKTESAENIWGEKVPYLVSVKSSGDNLSPQYSSVVVFEKEELTEIAKALTDAKNIKTMKNIIEIKEKSKSGTVLKVTFNKKDFTGEDIRKAFSLKSPAFTVEIAEKTVTFKVTGYGHGVGMSQYGADFMARQGSTYEEILKHYYKGIEIKGA
ncbi:MAG: stage II sporulation protein D [Acutalibacteraceae bacterium]|nr:stage II sporulation protein D [Acutalibacteraceae bacterium]